MGKIIDDIQGTIAAAIRMHHDDLGLSKLDDRAGTQLGIILTNGVLEVMAANAARRQARSVEGVEANRELVVDIQKGMVSKIAENCGLDESAANTLVGAVIMGTGRFQPDMQTLRHELLGDGPKSAKHK